VRLNLTKSTTACPQLCPRHICCVWNWPRVASAARQAVVPLRKRSSQKVKDGSINFHGSSADLPQLVETTRLALRPIIPNV
jgi:hypothetical protein